MACSEMYEFFSGFVRFVLHSATKIFLSKMNKLVVYNTEVCHRLVEHRPPGKPLITFSNHYSCMDDPFIWGTSSWRVIWRCSWSRMRWVPTAKEICFTTPWKVRFFTYNRCIPVIRGDGVYQPGMDQCLDKLNNGGWVHVFPEGKVNAEKKQMRLKWGIGRLIVESKEVPIVLPMFHLGFDSLLPNKKPHKLQWGQKVTVVVGEPIDYTDFLNQLKQQQLSAEQIRKIVTDDVQEKFRQLRMKTEKLHFARQTG